MQGLADSVGCGSNDSFVFRVSVMLFNTALLMYYPESKLKTSAVFGQFHTGDCRPLFKAYYLDGKNSFLQLPV